MRTRSLRTAVVLSFAMLVGAVALVAQTNFASFTGTIRDKDGSPVPSVGVTATNVATQVKYSATSNDQGLYTISALPIGDYKVRAELQGFRVYETSPIKLESGQTARVDITMQLGFEQSSRGHRCRTHPPDSGRRGRRSDLGDDHQEHAAQRPQLLPTLTALARRDDHGARHLHRAEELRPGTSVRQRPAGAGEQLHARRRRHERGYRQPAAVPAEPRRARGGPRRDQQLLCRVRQRGGGGHRQHDQIGH